MQDERDERATRSDGNTARVARDGVERFTQTPRDRRLATRRLPRVPRSGIPCLSSDATLLPAIYLIATLMPGSCEQFNCYPTKRRRVLPRQASSITPGATSDSGTSSAQAASIPSNGSGAVVRPPGFGCRQMNFSPSVRIVVGGCIDGTDHHFLSSWPYRQTGP